MHGRKVDTIVSGGENVMPQEVEAVLLSHPAVAEAAVIGRPGPGVGRGGHRVRRPARADAPDLREFARARLAPFKVPKAIEEVGELPRNAAGKILRRELT